MEFSCSTQQLVWFKDRYQDGSLVLKPAFQRKPVWAARQKCYLVESILMALPVPEVYVQQTVSPDGKAQHAVVDGQQRIRTVLQFIGVERDPDEEQFNKFMLDKLPTTSPWKDQSFDDLDDSEKSRFYSYDFSVRYLKTDSDDDVKDMFRRLNKFLTPLNAQELRNATYAGPFMDLAQRLADNEYWVEKKIVTPAMIRRMKDIEFVSELLIGTLHGPQGGSSKVIDDYYKQYEDYEDEFPDQRRASRLFDETITAIQTILPNLTDTRWSNRADFYTLFVSTAALLRSSELRRNMVSQLKAKLASFAAAVDRRLGDESYRASDEIVEYVRAVEKGVNDKKRRADRHAVLLNLLAPFFKSQRGPA